MYSLAQLRRGLKRGLSTPALFGREVNRLYHRRVYSRAYNTDGVDVVEADWDTLLILDACRYDLFAQRADLPGTLTRRRSRGSHTREFLRGNFAGRTLHDTVYVTASPQLSRVASNHDLDFHDVINVWQEDGWDENVGTVLPETTTEYARRALEEYPNKRLIVHYLQPHYPFLDAPAQLNVRTFGGQSDELDIWGALMRGEFQGSATPVRDAYKRNLDAVLPSIKSLLDDVDGRTVVTADHGNMLGERASPMPIIEWGHPPGIYTPELVDVPWLVYENGPRRHIVAEAPAGTRDGTEAAVTERLEQLGYVR